MKFSGTMCLMIILKFTKNQGFTLSVEDTFFEKPQEESQIDPPLPPTPTHPFPPSLFRVKEHKNI